MGSGRRALRCRLRGSEESRRPCPAPRSRTRTRSRPRDRGGSRCSPSSSARTVQDEPFRADGVTPTLRRTSDGRNRWLCVRSAPVAHRVTLIPGDGTGPELTEATRRVLEATGVAFDWDVKQAGVDVMETAGTPLPEDTHASVKEHKVALKGPITTPIGTGFRSVNVALRHELGLYACLRPCKTYPGVRSRYEKVDLVLVRENTEDLYAGIEFSSGSDEAHRVIDSLNGMQPKHIAESAGLSIKPISPEGSERIIRYAFEYAQQHGRKAVHCITKANIMKHTDGLFLSVFREVAGDYPDIEPRENLVDALCMGLVQRPEEFDVLVLPNLYGDIISDLTA